MEKQIKRIGSLPPKNHPRYRRSSGHLCPWWPSWPMGPGGVHITIEHRLPFQHTDKTAMIVSCRGHIFSPSFSLKIPMSVWRYLALVLLGPVRIWRVHSGASVPPDMKWKARAALVRLEFVLRSRCVRGIRLGNGKGCVGTSNPAPVCLLASGVNHACICLTVASEMVVL